MRTTGGMLGVPVRHGALALLVLAGALSASATPAAVAGVPQPVSPGAQSAGALVEARCPTFSWAGVEGAVGYELAVFRVAAAPEAEPVLVTRTSLPERVQTWTPAMGQCLERGERYAWSVAAAGGDSGTDGALDWAPVLLFEVDSAPSSDELEQAIATIQRHLATRGEGDALRHLATRGDRAALRAFGTPARETEPSGRADIADLYTRRAAALAVERPRVVADRAESFLPGALSSSTSGTRAASAASTPTAGPASLSVTDQVHLGAASDLFKDGSVFLWDDDDGNTALGRNALASVSGDATNNTAFGRRALENTTGGDLFEGHANTAVGDLALLYNTTGDRNTASGAFALVSNTTGHNNTASGASALKDNTTGSRNTASGSFALYRNTTGDGNTASGYQALGLTTTGSFNTATGRSALQSNSTGFFNTGTGAYALLFNTTGNRNTATGYRALIRNTDGAYNTAAGARALEYNTTGSSNTATGIFALLSNTTGALNTASGALALTANTIGFRNTASGAFALLNNTTGSRNTASGVLALSENTTGFYSVAIGYRALTANTTGTANTAIGFEALRDNTTGSGNIAIGHIAGWYTTGSNNIMIRNAGVAGESNVLRIGQSSGTLNLELDKAFIHGIRGRTTGFADAEMVVIDSAGQLGTMSSSRALKQDVQDLGSLADRLLELRPVAFRFKQHVASDPATALQFGLIAEEVAEVFPELVVYDDAGKPRTVKYHLLSSLLLGELQKQHGELDELRSRLAALESRSGRAARRRGGGDLGRGSR
jgi:trimeric autotransporter adhesin